MPGVARGGRGWEQRGGNRQEGPIEEGEIKESCRFKELLQNIFELANKSYRNPLAMIHFLINHYNTQL